MTPAKFNILNKEVPSELYGWRLYVYPATLLTPGEPIVTLGYGLLARLRGKGPYASVFVNGEPHPFKTRKEAEAYRLEIVPLVKELVRESLDGQACSTTG